MKKLGQKNIFLPINIMFQLINLPLLLSQKALDKCCIQCFQNSKCKTVALLSRSPFASLGGGQPTVCRLLLHYPRNSPAELRNTVDLPQNL